MTFSAVIVGLFAIVRAAGRGAVLGRRELLEARREDAVQLLMLSAMGHNFVGVCAVVVTL